MYYRVDMEVLERCINAKGIRSKTELCKKTGMCTSTLKKLSEGKSSMNTARRLSILFGISVCDLIVKEEIGK